MPFLDRLLRPSDDLPHVLETAGDSLTQRRPVGSQSGPSEAPASPPSSDPADRLPAPPADQSIQAVMGQALDSGVRAVPSECTRSSYRHVHGCWTACDDVS
jgi:hypothetical protein